MKPITEQIIESIREVGLDGTRFNTLLISPSIYIRICEEMSSTNSQANFFTTLGYGVIQSDVINGLALCNSITIQHQDNSPDEIVFNNCFDIS